MSRDTLFPLASVALFALLLLSTCGRMALAHGSASWIMEDPAISYCCNPRDCHRVEVRPAPGGWEILRIADDGEPPHPVVPAGIVISFDNITATAKRPGFWACFYLRDGQIWKPEGLPNPVRCFFSPETET